MRCHSNAVLSHIQQCQPGPSSISVTLRQRQCSILEECWSPPRFLPLVWGRGHLLLGLVQGQTATRVLGPGLAFWDSREMASDAAGALSTTRRWLRWEVFFALGPTTCLKALPGPTTQRFLDKPGSLVTGRSLTLPSLANRLESPCQLGKKTEAPLAPQTTETDLLV